MASVMADTQLYLAIGVPMLFNAILTTILISYVNAKIGGLEQTVNERSQSINQHFDDMRQLWLTELHRFEGVLAAPLRHLEEDRGC